jgi:hypothetical protein
MIVSIGCAAGRDARRILDAEQEDDVHDEFDGRGSAQRVAVSWNSARSGSGWQSPSDVAYSALLTVEKCAVLDKGGSTFEK